MIKRRRLRTRGSQKKQRGQALVLGMFLMLVAAASVVVLYNTAQAATEKTRLVNAADASAYSGAVYTARQLNFMAYTNRAMLSNHVMAGHLVSYVSWLRYVEEATDNIESVTSALATISAPVPYLGAIMRAIDQGAELLHTLADTMLDITEPVAKVFLIGVDGLNRVMSFAQNFAFGNMQVPSGVGSFATPLHQIMQSTAKYHTESETILVNHPQELASLSGAISAINILGETEALFNYSRSYIPYESATRNRMRYMVNESLGPSERWINRRTWSSNWVVVRMKKEATTEHELPSYDGDSGDWNASDRLRYKFPIDLKWRNIGSDRARATESDLYPNYKGIPSYYDLEDLTPSQDDRNFNFNITAYTTMPLSESRLKSLMGMGGAPQKMAAVARAQVYHKRPTRFSASEAFRAAGEFESFGSRNNEYANVYNPFWEAKLTKLPSLF